MILTMHGLSTMHCNLRTDIRMAKETGYEALEIEVSKLLRYLDQGFPAAGLNPIFEEHGIRPVMINAIKDVDRCEGEERLALMSETERISAAAEAIGCPTIQLVPFSRLEGRPWSEVKELTAKNLAAIADIGQRHGVRYQLEPIAFSPIHSLSQSLEVIELADRDNLGMVIDFWHLFAGGETTPSEVAALDKDLIYGVHFCDGMGHKEGTQWDEKALRGYLAGDGEINVQAWVDAVLATGFDGVWSSELLSPRHWEWDLWALATECRLRLERFVPGAVRS